MRLTRRLATVILVCSLALGSVFAQGSPEWALRGVKAYQEGRLELSRMYFQRAMEDAVLRGMDEWLVKAALNLIDLELESHDIAAALLILDKTPRSSHPELEALLLWKKAQILHAQKRVNEAAFVCDSALAVLPSGHAARPALEADRIRIAISRGTSPEWSPLLKNFIKKHGKKERILQRSLRATAAMQMGAFKEAQELWSLLVEDFRGQGRLSQVAASLNKLAVCRLALGDSLAALEENNKAVGIYRELGLLVPALTAQALKLLIEKDTVLLAKSRREMDLVSLGSTGFDLQDVLDEYAQILSARPPLR